MYVYLSALVSGLVILLAAWIFFQKRMSFLKYEIVEIKERLKQKESMLLESDQKLHVSDNELKKATIDFAMSQSEKYHLQERLDKQVAEIQSIRKQFQVDFENIANRILKENSLEFTTLNEKNIGNILLPLKAKIDSFEKKVDDTYEKGLRDQTDLKAELLKLNELNSRISQEANNLTKALKSDFKKQGNWGEVVLERILERSGLTLGQEYERESVQKNVNGETIRPDVIIHLPDNKQIIVDSKVSLVDYERSVNAEDDQQKNESIKKHLAAIKNHTKLLSEKHYQSIGELNTPDFVLLFIPIESCFSVAVQEDQELFNFAWDRKVVIVSPSTLLATLRTIASIWKQENQTRNAKEIARLGGMLYDKLVGVVTDLEKVKLNIDRAGVCYEDAMKKIQFGNANLFRTAEKMKELGAKVNKELPPKFLD